MSEGEAIEAAWQEWIDGPEGTWNAKTCFAAGYQARDAEVQALEQELHEARESALGASHHGYQARDAEVQKLREALEQIRDAPWPRNDHAEFSENLQEIARAALAGEETTDE